MPIEHRSHDENPNDAQHNISVEFTFTLLLLFGMLALYFAIDSLYGKRPVLLIEQISPFRKHLSLYIKVHRIVSIWRWFSKEKHWFDVVRWCKHLNVRSDLSVFILSLEFITTFLLLTITNQSNQVCIKEIVNYSLNQLSRYKSVQFAIEL